MSEQTNGWSNPVQPERVAAVGGLRSGQQQIADPWIHRSSGMRCRTCIWFVGKEPQALTVTVKSHEIGRCRRHAPTMGGYPVVYMTDWCGDHRLDENKV